MILPPTSQISRHHKVTNITMSPTSLSPIKAFRFFFANYAPSEIKFSRLSTGQLIFRADSDFCPRVDPNLGAQNSDAISYPVVSNIEFVIGIST